MLLAPAFPGLLLLTGRGGVKRDRQLGDNATDIDHTSTLLWRHDWTKILTSIYQDLQQRQV